MAQEARGDGAVCDVGRERLGLAQHFDARLAQSRDDLLRELRVDQRRVQQVHYALELCGAARQGHFNRVVIGRDFEPAPQLVRKIFARGRVRKERVAEEGHRSRLARHVKGRAAVNTQLDEHVLVARAIPEQDAQAVKQFVTVRLRRRLGQAKGRRELATEGQQNRREAEFCWIKRRFPKTHMLNLRIQGAACAGLFGTALRL